MTKIVRYGLIALSGFQIVLAIGFYRQLPFAARLWPFEGTTPLTYIFLSSIFAAAATSTLWVAARQEYGALAGIGLDYLAILIPVSVFAFQLGAATGNPQLTAFGAFCVLGAVYGLGLLVWSRRFPLDRSLPLPAPVKSSFVLFVGALLILSGLLILRVPNVIPWTITPDLSVIIGWMFAGAAAYFIYALLRPGWLNAAGQLAGFLVYDLVLIVPFLTRLPAVAPEFRLGLIVYTAFVIYSGLLAGYYLFVRRPKRVVA